MGEQAERSRAHVRHADSGMLASAAVMGASMFLETLGIGGSSGDSSICGIVVPEVSLRTMVAARSAQQELK
jgi:hypothetical protein